MWPFSSKKSAADRAVAAMPRAIEVACQKWVEFYAQDFAKDMPLVDLVAFFVEGLEKGLRQWRDFKTAPDAIFLLIAVKGIEKSRTHLRLQLESALNLEVPAPHERTDEEEQAELQSILIDRVARKWSYFEQTLKFEPDVSLAERIKLFKVPFLEGLRRDFPMFAKASDNEFDSLIAIGIDRSGSTSIIEVYRALGRKF